jgi:excisionase family DNA binding protein
MYRPSNSSGAGDLLIEAIAEAVAAKLERMAGAQQRLMDVHDTARYLGMTENAIREKVSAGDLPCIRIDGKLRFDRRELDRWIDRAPRQGV